MIFRSDDILVRTALPDRRDILFVTFDCYTEQDTLDRPGFGEAWFQAHGLPAIHVLQRRNRWWQHTELPEALAAIRAVAAGFDRVITYGSSLGGFAALTYGGAIGADVGFAISPQFSVDPMIAPFETRWRSDIPRIRFLKDVAAPSLPLQYIAFDPADAADAQHAALFAARSPTVLLPARYGGHPVGAFLNETGALPLLLEQLAAPEDNPHLAETVMARLRAGRRSSGQYLYALAQKLPRHHLPAKLALARMACAIGHGNPVYASFQADVLDLCGRHDEALALHEEAYAHPLAGAAVAWALMGHHVARGREAEAERIGIAALQRYPRSPQLRRKVRWLKARRLLRLDRFVPSLGIDVLVSAR